MTDTAGSRPTTASGTGGAMIEDSDEGKTHISDIVVAKIAAAACREVGGIHDMGSTGVGSAVTGALAAVTGGTDQQSTKGVSVQVGEHEAIVNVNIIVDYGARIPQIADALRSAITERLAILTGLTARAVNIEVSDVYFPPQQTEQQPQLA
jgi:uncharacterized alkaline shock family protein YloU